MKKVLIILIILETILLGYTTYSTITRKETIKEYKIKEEKYQEKEKELTSTMEKIEKQLKDQSQIQLDSYLIPTTLSNFEKQMQNNKKFIVIFSRDDCPHCQKYKPILEKILNKYQIIGYEIDTKSLNEEDYSKTIEEYGITGTPTTLLISDNKVIETIIGSKEEKEIVDVLTKNGYISEE